MALFNLHHYISTTDLHATVDDVCLTSTVDNEDEFRDELDLSICIVKKPSDIVILYDDEAVYNSMKTRLFQEERDACDNWYERTSKL